MNVPELGWCSKAHNNVFYDGDTLRLKIEREIRIRLRDCWVYELDEKNPDKKAIAIAAKAFMQEKIKNAKDVRVFIPGEESEDISKIITFNRFIGDIYVDGENLAKLLIKEKLASSTKGGKLGE